MVRIIILLSLTIPLLFIHACAQNKSFVSSEGGFSIDLTAPPFEEKNAPEATLGGKKLKWRNEGVLFTVSYVDKADARNEDAEATVTVSADGYTGAIPKSAEIIARNKIVLDGHPGVEVKAREKDGFTVIARYYMVDKRLYCIMAMWPAGPNDEYALKTIDSFKVIKPATVQ
jgi:hypothetical protein